MADVVITRANSKIDLLSGEVIRLLPAANDTVPDMDANHDGKVSAAEFNAYIVNGVPQLKATILTSCQNNPADMGAFLQDMQQAAKITVHNDHRKITEVTVPDLPPFLRGR